MPLPRPAPLPHRLALAAALALAALAAGAADAPPPGATPPPTASRPDPAEPAVQRTTIEDEAAVIEELRVRGQTQRAVVRSKLPSVRPYEIVTPTDGRDPTTPARGATGQRVWQVLNF